MLSRKSRLACQPQCVSDLRSENAMSFTRVWLIDASAEELPSAWASLARPNDSEFFHAEVQCRPVQSESRRRTFRSGEHPLRVLQDRTYMRTLDVCQCL